MARYSYIVVGVPVLLEEFEEELPNENSEIKLFDGWELDDDYGILGKKVLESSKLNGQVGEVHNKDLLTSYRKHRPDVERELQERGLVRDSREVSLYFVVSIE